MSYNVIFSDLSKSHIEEYANSDPTSYTKIVNLLLELIEHPRTGTGRPEKLKNSYSNYWSRRINKKDRLVYRVDESENTVYILRAKGHYNDK